MRELKSTAKKIREILTIKSQVVVVDLVAVHVVEMTGTSEVTASNLIGESKRQLRPAVVLGRASSMMI